MGRLRSGFLIVLCSTGLLLVACKGQPVLPDLPEGEQTIEGMLKPAEISAKRRGSHIIVQDGVDVYFAESSTVNLRQYQGKFVTLQGTFEHNIDVSDLPVLVVGSIVDVEDTEVEHRFASLRLTLRAPVLWILDESQDRVTFRIEGDTNDEGPVLTIEEHPGDELPEGGVPVVIDATRAVRIIDDLTGDQIVAVRQDGRILTFRFMPGSRITADRLREEFMTLLRSVEFMGAARSSTSQSTGSSVSGVDGSPCGGSAGILCPSGQYCEVVDVKENIGRCRRM